ncbi:MAG: hypothetical protein WCL53_06715 [Chloroflexota bacterium]
MITRRPSVSLNGGRGWWRAWRSASSTWASDSNLDRTEYTNG